MGDARAWLIWALTTLLTASYNRNPLYSILLLLVTAWVYAICAVEREKRSASLAPLRFAPVTVSLAALFNVLASSAGATVLLYVPDWMPLVGSAVTLEALVFGVINGLNLTVIFSSFAVFNRALTTRKLLQLTPRAFHESGVVLSVALTFVPQTIQNLKRIREAQAIRGHRVQGIRDWVPILTPLLVGALERALALAESMVARGYAAVSARSSLRTEGLLALSLLILLGGWLAYIFAFAAQWLAITALLLGLVLLGTALWRKGRTVHHTVYHAQRWSWHNTLVVIGALPLLILLLTQRTVFTYNPYPALTWPPFDPLTGLSIMGLLLPALFIPKDHQNAADV